MQHASPGALGLGFALDLPVRNEWGHIERLRASVQSCFQAVCADQGDRDTCDALVMVTSELLENALKYGAAAGWEPGTVRLQVCGNGERVRITVQHPVVSGDARAAELLRTLDWIQGFPSPADAYRARLVEIAASEDWERMRGRLGLVRVAYEGNCDLAARIDEGILSVTATMRLCA